MGWDGRGRFGQCHPFTVLTCTFVSFVIFFLILILFFSFIFALLPVITSCTCFARPFMLYY